MHTGNNTHQHEKDFPMFTKFMNKFDEAFDKIAFFALLALTLVFAVAGALMLAAGVNGFLGVLILAAGLAMSCSS